MAILIYLNAVPQSAAFAEKTSVSVMPFSEYSGVREDLALDRHCQRRDRRARYGFVANGPVDLDQYLLSGICATCKRAANREPDMGERSESKRVCRRSALALFGYAAAFGLVASPAILMVSPAGAQTSTTPATPSTETPKSGTERRQERRTGRAERRQERRTGRAERREERRTGREERRDARDGTAEQKK